jgi:hypothetical protein
MGLYHADLGLPKINFPQGIFKLRYSDHAKREAKKETLELGLPASLNTMSARIVEVETAKQKTIKIVYRQHYFGQKDLIIVVSVVEYPWVVKTIWINHVDDNHSTLKKEKYNG